MEFIGRAGVFIEGTHRGVPLQGGYRIAVFVGVRQYGRL